MRQYKLLKEQVNEYEDQVYNLEIEREHILEDYREALSQGDLSENSAYTSSRQRLQENDLELSNLRMILDNYEIVDESMISKDIIDIGTKITLTDNTGKEFNFTFVTEGSGSIIKRTISQMSDVGNAIFGRTVGDQVEVKSNAGEVNFFTIKAIS